jgi:hypothetical protein
LRIERGSGFSPISADTRLPLALSHQHELASGAPLLEGPVRLSRLVQDYDENLVLKTHAEPQDVMN